MPKPLRTQITTTDVEFLVERNPFVLPEFQRGEVWNRSKKSALIASLLQGYGTLPLVIIKGETQNVKHLLDGLQRFTAIRKYINDEYKLVLDDDIEIEPELRAQIEGKKFSELPENLQRQLKQTIITLIQYEVPKERENELIDIALEIFKRINRNPTPLKTGHLLYILTYTPDITPMIAETIKEISPKEDKNREIFRSIARYLTLLENYDLFKERKVNYPSGKYYSFVRNTLVLLKEDYLNRDEKGKEELRKEIKKELDNFKAMHEELFNYLYDHFYEKLKKTKYSQLVEEYISKHNTPKEFDKFYKKLRANNKEIAEEEAKSLFMQHLRKNAEQSAERKITTEARKLAESYSVVKKVWVGDVFAVFAVQAKNLGYRSIRKFMEEIGDKAFLKLIENPQFRTFVQEKKRDNRIWEFIEYGEQAIQEVAQGLKKQQKEDEKIIEEFDKALDGTQEETAKKQITQKQTAKKQRTQNKNQAEEIEDIDLDISDIETPKKIVEKKLNKKFQI